MARLDPLIAHLLRRAGFGVSAAEAELFRGANYWQAVDFLLAYPGEADVDGSIGASGFLGVTASGGFSPNSNIAHARQRWIFRMVHSPAPLVERMALVLHHHFATGYTKVAGVVGASDGARLMAAVPEQDPVGQVGQVELLRRHAFGSFRDLLIAVAQDAAMLYWLDGVSNVKARPQENFARELMELFTFGVGNFTEADVYAAARVFTGWNLSRTTASNVGVYRFQYNQAQHDTGAKEFTFPVGGPFFRRRSTIPARSASTGLQDGIDLITALAYHPETARRLAARLWTWFVSETEPPPADFINRVTWAYFDNRTSLRAVMRSVLTSPEFTDPSCRYQRYSWPVEFVARTLREVGPVGFSANDALTPLVNMGQQLYDPPDVNGWELGPAWFSTGGMLARQNFAAQVATNQRVALRDAAAPHRAMPESLIDFAYDRLTLPPRTAETTATLVNYLQSGGAWTGSDSQLLARAAGLVHLLAGSADYQLV